MGCSLPTPGASLRWRVDCGCRASASGSIAKPVACLPTADFPHIWRQSAVFVDKTLKGARPADLPIQQATRFELVINMKTAKALGVTISQSLLQRTDEVIQ